MAGGLRESRKQLSREGHQQFCPRQAQRHACGQAVLDEQKKLRRDDSSRRGCALQFGQALRQGPGLDAFDLRTAHLESSEHVSHARR
ncbi:hypothetical protein Q3G72_030150 [Acer saccharum]|nr:hypothetical protein Q3G72_018583 [Acer saccharum]KAK1548568.1 hypothetical protein Q3G72_030150 [Acer saccharum]